MNAKRPFVVHLTKIHWPETDKLLPVGGCFDIRLDNSSAISRMEGIRDYLESAFLVRPVSFAIEKMHPADLHL